MKDLKVLLLSAGGPAGVNYLKALKLGGITSVFGADSNPYHLVFCEKHTLRSFKIPRWDEDGYIDKINEIISKYEIDFVHAQSDQEVFALSENRDDINAKVFLPDHHIIKVCQDKLHTARIWSKLWPDAIAYEIKDNDDLLMILAQVHIVFPSAWIRAISGAGGRGSTPCITRDTAYFWLRYWWERYPNMEFMAQNLLPGRNIAWQSVWKDGKLLVSQARERVEYIYPNLAPSGVTGTPVVQRTINDSDVNFNAAEAVRAIDPNPNGIYSVDLKENSSGQPIPTEINAGRFFTTSYFFAYAGQMFDVREANMPLIYTMLGAGREIPHYEKRFDILDEDIYWIRHIDCGHKLTTRKCLDL